MTFTRVSARISTSNSRTSLSACTARRHGTLRCFRQPSSGAPSGLGFVDTVELGLDLYHVDLSRIVSKYIGETEKNLARVFDAAETSHAILLFDEADSLFAKRSEVKSSNASIGKLAFAAA